MPQTEFQHAEQGGSPAQLPPTAPQLSVVYRTLNDLKPDPRNPRSHSRQQIRQIAKSISTFGFNVPVRAFVIRLNGPTIAEAF
jgi:hypothetical protein